MKRFLILVLFVMVLSSVSSVIFYDQGTGVVNSTGDELTLGNLTVLFYDLASGGSLVYSETFNGSIVN
ncbi:MAG: hypothetical protein PF542_06665, partial [Nanoarchaeota archaeon]|nr:hypothetical protein [Nanoarchaeota archaeon]